MADDRRIVIELKNIDFGKTAAGQTNKIVEENSQELTKTLKTLFHPIQTLEQQTISRNVIVNQAVHQGLQVAKQATFNAANYYIEKYFTLSENYKSEQDFSNVMTAFNKITGFSGTVGSGAIAGAQVGGGWGAVIGAVIGAGGWITNEVFGAKSRRLSQELGISTNNSQSQFQQTRLGLTTGRGVTNQ